MNKVAKTTTSAMAQQSKPEFTEVSDWSLPEQEQAPIRFEPKNPNYAKGKPPAERKLARPKEGKQLQANQWRATKKQRLAMSYWLEPSSETFGNAYRSFLRAGFSKSYSMNVVNKAPQWLVNYVESDELADVHIRAGVQAIAKAAPNSKSPDDTRLKAYELLAKITGLLEGNKTQVTVVTPILGGQSQQPKRIDVDV